MVVLVDRMLESELYLAVLWLGSVSNVSDLPVVVVFIYMRSSVYIYAQLLCSGGVHA